MLLMFYLMSMFIFRYAMLNILYIDVWRIVDVK